MLAPTLNLEGENASLRYAIRLARNLAISEARRLKRIRAEQIDDLERAPEAPVDPNPAPDEELRRAVQRCLERLPRRPAEALRARLRGDRDRDLAASLGMRLNTFLQNIVRARRLMAECLRAAGVNLAAYIR